MKVIDATLLFLFLIMTGCGSSGGDELGDALSDPRWDLRSGDTGSAPDGAASDLPPGAWTIEKAQTLPGGTSCTDDSDFIDLADGVYLPDVVAATPVFPFSDDLEGYFAVSGEPGPWSGILVVFDRGLVTDLQVGDHTAVHGDLVEFYCNTQINASSVTLLGGMPTPPAPAILQSGTVVSDGSAESEDYEGCLVSFQNVAVTAVDPQHNSFTIDGGLEVDDDLFSFDSPSNGCTFTTITGMIQYTFGRYVLLPRVASDLQNDGSPECGESPDPVPTSVFDLQNSDVSKTCIDEMFVDGGSVSLTDVVVTTPAMSISNGKFRGYHVQEQEGGPWSGVLVLWETDGSPPSLSVGVVLNVTGDWKEFDCLSVVMADTWKIKEPWTGSFHPESVDPALLATGDPGAEAWEGVIVEVDDVTVGQVDQYGDIILEGSGLVVSNEFVNAFEVQPAASFSSIIGVVYYSFDKYRLLPRSLDDLLK